MIEVRNLVKEYRGAEGSVVRAVDDVSFAVSAGEMVGLLGGNGAGKTTTMRVVATLLAPTSGTAVVAGRDVRLDPIGVRQRLAYVSATTGVPDRLTPREKIARSLAMFDWTRGLVARQIVAERGAMGPEQLRWEVALRLYGADPGARRIIERQLAKVRGDVSG